LAATRRGAIEAREIMALPSPKGRRRPAWLLFFVAVAALAAWVSSQALSLPSSDEIARLKSGQVHDSAMIRQRVREAAEKSRRLAVHQSWVELEEISRPAINAVLASEDARFFKHGALDLKEVDEALHGAVDEGKPLRGASTLSQQVAKNLFLGDEHSFWRKSKEAYLAWRLESALSKRRILRLYLNIAEWGEGVFGIEAAAQAHRGKRAADLTLGEGAALAAMLPNPHRFTPSQPAVLRRRAAHVLERCLADHVATAEEVEAAKAELDRWLGPLDEKAPDTD